MAQWSKLQSMSADEQKSLQDHLLRELVQTRLYPFSDYYRRLFDENGIRPDSIRRVEDLANVPFTSKKDLMPTDDDPERPRRFILQPTPEKIAEHWPLSKRLPLLWQALIHGKQHVKRALRREYYPVFMTFTTGRSAQPVPFLYTSHDLDTLRSCGKRLVDVLGFTQDYKVLNLFPYAPHLAFWQVTMAGMESEILVLGTGGGRVAGTEGNIRALSRMNPQAIIGVPGYLYHLLRVAESQGVEITGTKLLVLGADTVPEGLKFKLRDLMARLGSPDVHVLGTYGFTEARTAFAECPTSDGTSSGYHVYPDEGIFEVIDPMTGEVLSPDSDGELVYTPLNGRGTTVFRYRTGDLVDGGIKLTKCKHCGRMLPRVSSRLKRRTSATTLDLLKVKGTLINVEEIGQVVAGNMAIEEWQVEIRKKDNDPHEVDELVIYIAVRAGADVEETKERLRKQVKAATEVTPNEIHVLPIDALLTKVGMEQEMKERRFVDTRTQA